MLSTCQLGLDPLVGSLLRVDPPRCTSCARLLGANCVRELRRVGTAIAAAGMTSRLAADHTSFLQLIESPHCGRRSVGTRGRGSFAQTE